MQCRRLSQFSETRFRLVTWPGIRSDIVFCLPSFFIVGHVGPPLPCNKIKLVDVPEMEYYAKDGKGEVRKSLNATCRIFFKDKIESLFQQQSLVFWLALFWCHVLGVLLRTECVQGIPVWWGKDKRKYRRGWLASLGGRGRMATSECHVISCTFTGLRICKNHATFGGKIS